MTNASAGPRSFDAIVIGAGHNGLVCAALLARAGLRVVVLERRDTVGGALAEVSLGEGFTVPAAAHTIGRLRDSVIRDLGLADHGLSVIRPAVRAFAPQPDGRSVTLWADPARTARELASWSAKDAGAFEAFDRKVRALASFLAISTDYCLFDDARGKIASLAQLSDCRVARRRFDHAGRLLSASIKSYVVKAWHEGDLAG